MLGIVLVTVLAFTAIGVRLFDLQARDRSHLSSLGLGQRVRTVAIPAERGNIFDRTGKVLAVSVPQTTIVADPRVIKEPLVYAAKLAPILHVDQAELETRLSNRKSAFAYVARKVDDPTAKQVRDLDLVGISFQDESRRFYPNGTDRRAGGRLRRHRQQRARRHGVPLRQAAHRHAGERAGRTRPAGQRHPRR